MRTPHYRLNCQSNACNENSNTETKDMNVDSACEERVGEMVESI